MIMALVALTTVAFTVQIWTSTRPQLIAWCGIAVELASLALFFAAIRASRSAALKAAFTSQSPHTLLRTGPYGVLRHPFYTSYVLFWIGWTLALFNLWVLPPTLILIVLYVLAARREEKKFDNTEMAAEYADYRAKTGFMWPRF